MNRATTNAATAAATSIPLIKPDLPAIEEIEDRLREALDSGRITNFGKHLTRFEEKARDYLGALVATTSSGTTGLILALQALGLEPGEKVILPSFTFVATAQAVLYAGGIPVFAEILEDLTVDPEDVERLLAQHADVGAVIGVHTYGLPCRVEEIREVVETAARKRGQRLPLIYDAAHAFGAEIHGRRVGTFGDAEVFSLSVTKALVSVEGGMVSSRNPDLIRRVQKMRNYGIEENYDAHYPGLNGKMSEFHAIVGLHNLERLDGYLAKRQERARYYMDKLQAHTNFEILPPPDGVLHTFKDLTVVTPDRMEEKRDEVMRLLKARGVETRAYFCPPIHQQRYFRKFADRPLPRTEALSRRVITLPFYTSITTEEIDYVANALAEAQRTLA